MNIIIEKLLLKSNNLEFITANITRVKASVVRYETTSIELLRVSNVTNYSSQVYPKKPKIRQKQEKQCAHLAKPGNS